MRRLLIGRSGASRASSTRSNSPTRQSAREYPPAGSPHRIRARLDAAGTAVASAGSCPRPRRRRDLASVVVPRAAIASAVERRACPATEDASRGWARRSRSIAARRPAAKRWPTATSRAPATCCASVMHQRRTSLRRHPVDRRTRRGDAAICRRAGIAPSPLQPAPTVAARPGLRAGRCAADGSGSISSPARRRSPWRRSSRRRARRRAPGTAAHAGAAADRPRARAVHVLAFRKRSDR